MSRTATPEELERIEKLAVQLSAELQKMFEPGHPSGLREARTGILKALEDPGLLAWIERLKALQDEADAAGDPGPGAID